MPERHSSVAGGSSAARIINCPGSASLLAKLPSIVNRDSVYSIEGTALHTVMEMLISKKLTLAKLRKGPVVIQTRSGPFTVTPALVATTVEPALEYWKNFIKQVHTFLLEAEVQFPGIEGAFGTTDILGRSNKKNITYISDWKFGAGEGVSAIYPDPDDPNFEIINEQLLFYATAARHTHPEFFPPGCRVVLTIIQPRAREYNPITSVEVGLEDLDAFAAELRQAVILSNGPTKMGRWCRFQPCQTICPHHTGALFNIEDLTAGNKLPAVVLDKAQSDYHITLLDILDAAPAVEALIAEARAQAHIMMGNGEEVPGWKLVAKRGKRQWTVDEDKLPKLLKLPKKDLYDVTLKSPAGVEKILGKKKLPEGSTTVVSSGTTIAPVSDKRPAVAADPNVMSKILLEAMGEDA